MKEGAKRCVFHGGGPFRRLFPRFFWPSGAKAKKNHFGQSLKSGTIGTRNQEPGCSVPMYAGGSRNLVGFFFRSSFRGGYNIVGNCFVKISRPGQRVAPDRQAGTLRI